MIELITKVVAPLKSRIHQLLMKGLITRVDDTKPLQAVQVKLGEENIQDLIRYQNFGFTSVPPDTSEAILLFPSGFRANGIAICVDNRKLRLKELKSGESALYNAHGCKVVLMQDGSIQIINGKGEDLITTIQKMFKDLSTALIGASNGGGEVIYTGALPTGDELKHFKDGGK